MFIFSMIAICVFVAFGRFNEEPIMATRKRGIVFDFNILPPNTSAGGLV